MTASGVEISIFEPDREETTRMKKLIIAVLTILALFISSSCGRRETELSSDDTEGTVHIDSTINDSTTDETTIKDTTANDTTVPESTESSDIHETTAETITSEPGTASDNLKIASVSLTTELPAPARRGS